MYIENGLAIMLVQESSSPSFGGGKGGGGVERNKNKKHMHDICQVEQELHTKSKILPN